MSLPKLMNYIACDILIPALLAHDQCSGVSSLGDGRIGISIHKSGGLEPGTWTFLVHGESVRGTEDDTFEWC